MPYKRKGKCVYHANTGKKVGCSTSTDKAKKYLKALYFHSPDARLKEVLKDLVEKVLRENEESNIADKQEKEVDSFDQYLKLPQNIGISFTQKEKDATNIPNLRPPFARSIFEIRYKSVEDIMGDGKVTKTNKTTVVKKIRMGETVVYKTFTLMEPTEKPSDDQKEPVAEAEAPAPTTPAGQKPAEPTDQKPDDKKQQQPPKEEKPKQKVIEITSNSFADVQGNVELFINFLKDVNEDIGL